jgi:hypothetical protein
MEADDVQRWEIVSLIREGGGAELVSAIREALRAIVFIGVPWSGPERQGRQVFRAAVAKLGQEYPDHGILFFRLEVDEDKISHDWLTSVGYPEFAVAGAGSLLWLELGKVLSTEINANSLGAQGIVDRSTSLW